MAWTIERHKDVAVVGINSHKVNIQNTPFFADLHAAFDRLEREMPDCAVVLRSEGSAFSAGLDFKEAFSVMQSDPETLSSWLHRYVETNLRLWQYPRPTIAAVHGAAIAGGFITAIGCDFRVCSPDAQFALNEVQIGIAFPYTYVELIRSALSHVAASRLMLFGETVDADTAKSLGVVHEITSRESLVERAVAAAERVPKNGYDAYAHTKQTLRLASLDRIARLGKDADSRLPSALLSPGSIQARADRAAALKR